MKPFSTEEALSKAHEYTNHIGKETFNTNDVLMANSKGLEEGFAEGVIRTLDFIRSNKIHPSMINYKALKIIFPTYKLK